MNLIFSTLVPVFGIMLFGALSKRFGILGNRGEKTLASYVLNLALPALMFISIAETPRDQLLNCRFLLCMILLIVLFYGLTFLISSFTSQSVKVNSMRAVIATFPNTAFMGIPISLELFGTKSLIPIVIINMLMMFVLSFTVVMLERGNRSSGRNISGHIMVFMKQPFLIGVAIGIIFSVSDISMPHPVSAIFRNIGSTTAPCALIVLGTSLNMLRIKSITREVVAMSFVKLVAAPVLAIFVLKLFHIPSTLAANTVILLALSPAIAIHALALEQKAYMIETSKILITSTIISAFTLSCFIFALPYIWPDINFIR